MPLGSAEGAANQRETLQVRRIRLLSTEELGIDDNYTGMRRTESPPGARSGREGYLRFQHSVLGG